MSDLVSEFHTVAEVADLLKVTPKTVRRWITNGDVVAHRFNGSLRIRQPDLDAFIRRHRGR
jgi:excisionase family DNA binding protein